MSIFLENSVYLVYLISLLMSHVPRRKKWHAKHCSIFRNTMIHTSGCSFLCGNVLPEMALFVFLPSCYSIYHRWCKERYSCIVSRKGRDLWHLQCWGTVWKQLPYVWRSRRARQRGRVQKYPPLFSEPLKKHGSFGLDSYSGFLFQAWANRYSNSPDSTKASQSHIPSPFHEGQQLMQ